MVQVGTMGSFRSTASTGVTMARPVDPRMPVISIAQVSGETEQRVFLHPLYESTLICPWHLSISCFGHFSPCVLFIHLPSIPAALPDEHLSLCPSIPALSVLCFPPYWPFLPSLQNYEMITLRMIFSVPRRLPERLEASHPGKDICSGHWERGGRDMKENPAFDWCGGRGNWWEAVFGKV